MKVVTGQEMRAIDQKAIAEVGIPSVVLMENAGTGIVHFLEKTFGNLANKRINILVGTGNNGGDGLVAARHLLNRDTRVRVFLVGSEEKLSPECEQNLKLYRNVGGDVQLITERNLTKLRFSLGLGDIIIDAILGLGCDGPLRGFLPELIRMVNKLDVPVVAVDIPTGVSACNGHVEDVAIKADYTVTLGFLKLGLVLFPGAEYAGEVHLCDIGIPKALGQIGERCWVTKSNVPKLAPRPRWGHKGTFGHGLVIAGSKSMAGAALLCAQAMLRTGAGMVTLAVPESIINRYPGSEIMVVPIPDNGEGAFTVRSVDALLTLCAGKDTLAIGPGMSVSQDTSIVVESVLNHWLGPAVIDADALNALTPKFFEERKIAGQNWVITPHPGELARLCNLPVEQINAERATLPLKLCREWGVTILLKGAPTITCSAGKMAVNSSGNPGMATAGMGDILTGIVGGLICQKMSPFEAAVAGAYFHGEVADQVMRKDTGGYIASDLLGTLPSILADEGVKGCRQETS